LAETVRQLELNLLPGAKLLDADEQLSSEQAQELLRKRVAAGAIAGSAGLQISAVSGTATDAQKLANALAGAYCNYRLQRRARIAQEAIAKMSGPFRENETNYQQIVVRLERARAELAPAVRHMESPPKPQESEALQEQRRLLARLTMASMVQSNQLDSSRNLPASEWQRIEEQYRQTTNEMYSLAQAVEAELRQQQAAKEFWAVREELDQAKQVLAPLQQAMESHRQLLTNTTNLPATIVEPAASALKLPPRNSAAFACLIGAVGALLTGAWLLGSGTGKPNAEA
jgi:hypothetical protein